MAPLPSDATLSSPTDTKDVAPISDIGELVAYLAGGARAPADWRIGTEHEKFGFRNDDLRPPTYEGPRGIGALLGAGWAVGAVG